MKMQHHVNRCAATVYVVFVLLIGTSISNAQITVTASQFLTPIMPGQTHYFRGLDPAFHTVNIGKSGGPNIYDYSLAKLTQPELSNNYLISSLPVLAARFPGAAFTFGTSRDSVEKNPVFLQAGDTVFILGQASLVPQYQFKHNRPYLPFIFPMTYQRTYTFSGNEFDTTYNTSGGVANTTSFPIVDNIIVDGYGTLKFPGRQVECLRLKMSHTLYGDKEIMFLTREGVFADIFVAAGQPDTGVVEVNNVTVLLPPAFVGVGQEASVPGDFSLKQNFPNPFNPTTSFEFQVPSSKLVELKVFDVLGREVTTLVNEMKAPGVYRLTWDASRYPSGVYFYRLQSGPLVQTKKLVLIK